MPSPAVRPAETAPERAASANLIAAEGVSVVVGAGARRQQILRDVSLVVPEGAFVCLVGPSGCGKSTLLKTLAGLTRPTSGRVLINGLAPREAARARLIGLVFQDANLLPWRNLIKNIALPFELKGRKPDHQRIAQLLDRVGLTGFDHKMPRELSGGMQQRASIVRSLAVNPSVLLMDEPFGALDAFTRDEMNLLIQEIWLETRKTIAFVTHSIAEAIFLADRVVVMSARPGRIKTVTEVGLPRPRNLFDIHADPQFRAIYDMLWTSLEDEVRRAAERQKA